MSFLGTLRKNFYALRGNKKYARFEELAKMQYLSQEELRNKQFIELSKLIEHAYDTTIYYNNLFKKLGITPKDIKSFEDYAKLPVLTKSIMQDNLEDLCSSATPKNMRILNSSGGTTGNPASFYQDNRVFSEMDAHWLLMLSMAGWTPDDMVVSIWGNPKDLLSNTAPSYIKPWLNGVTTLNAYRYDTQTMKMWSKVIKRYKRTFLYGYATVIADFAHYCLENNISDLPVFAVMTTAEILTPSHRACIEKAFSCKVFDQYGSREMPGVASQCKHGNMHMFTSAAYAEFLPFEATASTDTHKSIILTSLINYTMPMLRYEIGDLGNSSEVNCPCGRGYPLMEMNVGRIGSSLLLPDGGRLYSTMFVRQMYHIEGINTFQFRQTKLDHVDLYIIQDKNFNELSQQKLETLAEKFPKEVCLGASLSIHYVDDIPRTQGGKHRQVVCEVNQ